MSPMPLAGLCPGGRCPRRAEERRPAAGPRRPAAERPLGAVRRQRPSAAVAATARGSWRCSNSLLKRREAREARERKVGVYGRPACRLHLSMPAKDRSVAGTRGGNPVAVSFSCDSRDVIRVCEPCQGFVRRCKRCRRFHLVYQGQGGEYSMPWWVSESWLKEHECTRRDFGDVLIPFVWMPAGGDILAPGPGSSNSAPTGRAELGTLGCGATPVPSGLPASFCLWPLLLPAVAPRALGQPWLLLQPPAADVPWLPSRA